MLLVSILALIALNNPLAVSIWVNQDDEVYTPGENLYVYFSANQGCYLAVYNVEQGGGVTRLFPPDGDDGWIRGGQTYQLPSQSSDYDYVVSGPEGVETIVALASRQRLPTLDDEGDDIVTEIVAIQIKDVESAELVIVSKQKNCRVYVIEAESGAREYVGQTPRAVVLRPGEYFVEIKKVGYHSLERSVRLQPGETRKVYVKLSRY
jgi:hypothetical protein